MDAEDKKRAQLLSACHRFLPPPPSCFRLQPQRSTRLLVMSTGVDWE
jgi:hypothetical protein